jgi:hypothetical protein
MSGYALGQPISFGKTFQRIIVGANPAAGSGFTLKIDPIWSWRLVSSVFTLTTDANVANRYVTVESQDSGGNAYAVSAPAVLVTAGGTFRFVGSINQGVGEWNTGTDALFRLTPVIMRGGDQLVIAVGNIQVGDTLTKIRFTFDLAPTNPDDFPVLDT